MSTKKFSTALKMQKKFSNNIFYSNSINMEIEYSKEYKEYHNNITLKLPWWKNLVAPRVKLRARMWAGFEIYVGLNKKLRNMANYMDGMILIGDIVLSKKGRDTKNY